MKMLIIYAIREVFITPLLSHSFNNVYKIPLHNAKKCLSFEYPAVDFW